MLMSDVGLKLILKLSFGFLIKVTVFVPKIVLVNVTFGQKGLPNSVQLVFVLGVRVPVAWSCT